MALRADTTSDMEEEVGVFPAKVVEEEQSGCWKTRVVGIVQEYVHVKTRRLHRPHLYDSAGLAPFVLYSICISKLAVATVLYVHTYLIVLVWHRFCYSMCISKLAVLTVLYVHIYLIVLVWHRLC